MPVGRRSFRSRIRTLTRLTGIESFNCATDLSSRSLNIIRRQLTTNQEILHAERPETCSADADKGSDLHNYRSPYSCLRYWSQQRHLQCGRCSVTPAITIQESGRNRDGLGALRERQRLSPRQRPFLSRLRRSARP